MHFFVSLISLKSFLALLGSFRSTFVSEYLWPQTCRSRVTRLQKSRSPFAVHVWTSGKAVSVSSNPATFFFFLFESSHVCPINICELKSFLWNQSIRDARQPLFKPHFVCEMKDPHPLCNSRWRRTRWFFF